MSGISVFIYLQNNWGLKFWIFWTILRNPVQCFTCGSWVLTHTFFQQIWLTLTYVNNLHTHTAPQLLIRSSSIWQSYSVKVDRELDHRAVMMCLAGSLCLEELCGSVEVTREIFIDFHVQFGFFMWLQSLCNSLASGCCYISSNRTTMSLELQVKLKSLWTAHVGTLQWLNGACLYSRTIWSLINEICFNGLPSPWDRPGG